MDSFILSLVGKPYKPNSYDGHSFDCYSLIHYIYNHYGITIPKRITEHRLRNLHEKISSDLHLWREVSYNHRKFLDVLLFNTSKRLCTHVGLTLNNRLFIHAVDDQQVTLAHFKSSIYIAKLHKVYRWHTL